MNNIKKEEKKIFLGKNIKNQRLRLGLSQKEFALLFGLSSANAVLVWESSDDDRGKGFPSVSILLDMCEQFNWNIHDAFYSDLFKDTNGTSPPTESPPSVPVVTEGGQGNNKDPVREALREIVREELAKILQ